MVDAIEDIEKQHKLFRKKLKAWLENVGPEIEPHLDLEAGVYAFAPGRGNMIGEHIDYNGGTVAPVTIGPGCFCAAIPRRDGVLSAVNLAGEVAEGKDTHSAEAEVALKKLFTGEEVIPEKKARKLLKGEDAWAGLVIGAYYVLLETGMIPKNKRSGMQYLILSTVPIASGLSSSAALEVSSLSATVGALGIQLPGKDIARLGQRMEHAMRGVPCGRMDQSAAALGRELDVLALDCTTWKSDWHSLPKGCGPLFVDTRVPRSLSKSAYAKRRKACEKGLEKLNKVRSEPAPNLCSLSPEEYEKLVLLAGLRGDVERKCRHAVHEQERVKEFLSLLDELSLAGVEKERVERLGTLLYASHESLRDLYEVSCDELDAVVAIARSLGLEGGVVGARMQGAGFGGCAVVLAEIEKLDDVKERISQEYEEKTGRKCGFVSGSSPGAISFGIRKIS